MLFKLVKVETTPSSPWTLQFENRRAFDGRISNSFERSLDTLLEVVQEGKVLLLSLDPSGAIVFESMKTDSTFQDFEKIDWNVWRKSTEHQTTWFTGPTPYEATELYIKAKSSMLELEDAPCVKQIVQPNEKSEIFASLARAIVITGEFFIFQTDAKLKQRSEGIQLYKKR